MKVTDTEGMPRHLPRRISAPANSSKACLKSISENDSAKVLGVFDKELIEGLPASIKWIAHNGAGYDPVDVHACIAKGTLYLLPLHSLNNFQIDKSLM